MYNYMTDPILQPLWATVALAGLSALTGLFALLKARRIHKDVTTIKVEINSRMTELLNATKEAALSLGAKTEKARADLELAASTADAADRERVSPTERHPEADEEHSG